MSLQASRFVLVGLASTLVHVFIAAILVLEGLAPLLANLVAFLGAFALSFTGHQMFTFQGHGNPVSLTFLRYSITATTGFSLNQTLLYVLSVTFHMPPLVSLIISAGVTAVGSFLLSKVWAFRG